MESDLQEARDADARWRIAGSCRVIIRHVEGIMEDVRSMQSLPPYNTEAESVLNTAANTIQKAIDAIVDKRRRE